MVLVDYIGIFFYMLQYFWQNTLPYDHGHDGPIYWYEDYLIMIIICTIENKS